MPISMDIPTSWRMPLFWLQVDPSMAGLGIAQLDGLMVGHMIDTGPDAGNAVMNVPVPIGSKAQATAAFGAGSMLEAMFNRFFDNNFSTLVWGLPVPAPAAGVAAHGTITVAGPATDAGSLYVYIAGNLVGIRVLQDDTPTIIATNLAAAINTGSQPFGGVQGGVTLPVTAVAAAAVVTLTCKWVGVTGNDIDIRDNYLGTRGGEVMPPGVTLTYSNPNTPSNLGGKLAGGSGIPDCATAIANLGESVNFEYVALPWTDTNTMLDWNYEYGFDDGRWSWLREQYGMVFQARRGTYADHIIWAQDNNYPVLSVMAVEVDSPSPVWEWAAAYCSMGARAFNADPARPLQTLGLQKIWPAPKHTQFNITELNNMWGLARQKVGSQSIPIIMRESTTYQFNEYGVPDDAYEVLTTLATLARLFRDLKADITTKFPRHKLCDDDTRLGPGQAAVSPKIIKAEIIAYYEFEEYLGLVENSRQFKAHLIVERNVQDPNRLDVLFPPDIINQLRVFAVLGQFRLQYDRSIDELVAA
jgi:phage tail sheath gpL-like